MILLVSLLGCDPPARELDLLCAPVEPEAICIVDPEAAAATLPDSWCDPEPMRVVSVRSFQDRARIPGGPEVCCYAVELAPGDSCPTHTGDSGLP